MSFELSLLELASGGESVSIVERFSAQEMA